MRLFNKALSVLISLVIAIAVFVVPSASSAFATNTDTVVTGTVITQDDPLTLRDAPSGKKIGELPRGATIIILDSTNADWYKVSYNGNVGYASAQYIRINVPAPEYTPDMDFEQYLNEQKFPESYKDSLRTLHAAHPNWVFESFDPNLDWNASVKAESQLRRSLVQKLSSYPDAYFSYQQGAYNPDTDTHVVFDGSNWVQASEELVEYCMDPRNYLTESYIYAFLSLSYSQGETVENVNGILKGTFMEGAYPAEFDEHATYADAFLAAAKISGVSAYHLASRCRQEQGVNGSALSRGDVSGYVGYYNFFNINAYNNGSISNITMGAIHAKSKGWDTPYKSILGGAQFLAEGYIGVGQDTLYLQKFDLIAKGGYYNHQYMTNIQVAFSEASTLKKAITQEMMNSNLVFKIPVYRNMPESVCPKPTGKGANNYLLSSLSVEGHNLSPAFSAYTYEYELVVESDVEKVEVKAKTADVAASVTGTGSFSLNYGDNTVSVTVTAQSGTKRTYTIIISRQQPADPGTTPPTPVISGTNYTVGTYITGIAPETAVADFIAKLGVENGSVEIRDSQGTSRIEGHICSGDQVIIYKTDGTEYLSYNTVVYGDINGDGKITTVDLFMGQRQVLGSYTLTDARLEAADINKDGKISTVDLFMGQKHILGTYTIQQ